MVEQMQDTQFSDYYEPWWSAPSEFTPSRDESRSQVPAKVDLLSQIISETIGRKVQNVEYLANGVFHVVYTISFESGPDIVSRIAFNFREDDRGRAAVSLKMKQETGILRLVKTMEPEVPVPIVLYSEPDPRNILGAPYMLMEKLPGRDSGYANLKGNDMEAFVKSLAKTYIGVFNITLPKIGSYRETSDSGELIIGSIIDEREEYPGGPFDTVDEYLKWLFSSTLNHPRNRSETPNLDLRDLFHRLENLAQRLLPRPAVTRFSLAHLDPHERNLLVEGTEVTGLIDWEAHIALPTYLAACYPAFLRRDGIFDEQYVSRGDLDMMDPDPLLTSDEAQHLRQVFVKAAEEISPEFVEALQQGEKLRQLLGWLAFAEWDGSWVWKGCEAWERDVRASVTT